MKKLGSQLAHRVLTTAQVLVREVVPQILSAPVWLIYVILVIIEMGIGQENGDLLLSAASSRRSIRSLRLRSLGMRPRGQPRSRAAFRCFQSFVVEGGPGIPEVQEARTGS